MKRLSMFRSIAVATLVAVTFCSDAGPERLTSVGSTSPSNVEFQLDRVTCQGTHRINYFIDETLVATYETTAGGAPTPTIPVTPGTRTFRAEITDLTAVWGPMTMTVPAATHLEITLTCDFPRPARRA